MQINRKSPISGKIHMMDLPITEDQIRSYVGGTLLQDAFPQLTPEEREFYKTGITPEEWDDLFGREDAK